MKKKTAAAPAAETVVTVSKPEAKVHVLKVKAGLKFRGARDAWYAVLQKFDGKPANDYLEATTKNPPSVPKSGKVEKPTGWLRYFQRVGACSVVQQ